MVLCEHFGYHRMLVGLASIGVGDSCVCVRGYSRNVERHKINLHRHQYTVVIIIMTNQWPLMPFRWVVLQHVHE